MDEKIRIYADEFLGMVNKIEKSWEFERVFTPEETDKLAEVDEFIKTAISFNYGFISREPKTGIERWVYCQFYERDDSDPYLKKRRGVLVYYEGHYSSEKQTDN